MKQFPYTIVFILLNIIKCNAIAPNIVLILADDLGWNDIGHHGSSQIPTPNIDALAYNGIGLKKHYTLHICTPSRAALLTGKYPIRTGLQGEPITAGESRNLPLNVSTMAEKFAEIGYSTHMVGKWHLGHKYRNVTPTARGFHSYFGYWNGFCGYRDYEIKDQPHGYNGFDLHDGYNPAYEYKYTTYATDLFTDKANEIITKHNQTAPLFLYISHLAGHTGKNGLLEAKDPAAANMKYMNISNPKRRLFAEIVNNLDNSVGKVVKTLQDVGMLENSIVIFMSDNGAQTFGVYENFGSNWPLRGLKFTLYEGSLRNTAAIWSKLLPNKKYVEKNVVHITDWFPTLYAAAGGDVNKLGTLDGINQWPLFTTGIPQNKSEYLLLNIDEAMPNAAIMTRDGRYKLTQGTFNYGVYDGHYGDSGRGRFDPRYSTADVLNSDVNKAILAATNNAVPLTEAEILSLRSQFEIEPKSDETTSLGCSYENDRYCLFDLENDARELKDIKNDKTVMFEALKKALESYKLELVPQTNNKTVDPASNPAHCNNTWFTWGETDPTLKCANYA